MKFARYILELEQRLILLLIALSIAISLSAPSGSYAQGQLPDTLSASTTASILTILPGDPVYSAFGHTAVRFEDRSTGYDIVFNYGTFDDKDPFFIPKFTYGKLDYMLSYGSMRGLMAAVEFQRRILIEQRLTLSKTEIAGLYNLLRETSRPENRVYRYDFVWENCSTKVIDALREVTGTRLKLDSTGVTPQSFRELIKPYLWNKQLLDVGIDIIFGAGTDRNASFYERSFLPLELMAIFDDAGLNEVSDSVSNSARPFPLVAQKDTLLWFADRAENKTSFPWVVTLSWILLVGWFGLAHWRRSTRRISRVYGDRILFGVLGAAGILIVFLWFVSAHTVTASNLNLVWALPSHLWPALFWSRMTKLQMRRYFFFTGSLAATLLVLQPLLPQSLHAAILPVVITIAWRSWVIIRSTSSRREAASQ